MNIVYLKQVPFSHVNIGQAFLYREKWYVREGTWSYRQENKEYGAYFSLDTPVEVTYNIPVAAKRKEELSDALKLVLELAEGNVLSEEQTYGDFGLYQSRGRQLDACQKVQMFLETL